MPINKVSSRTNQRRLPGRPLDNPLYKASVARRFLVSPQTAMLIDQSMEGHGFRDDISNYLRWLVWKQLKQDGLIEQVDPDEDNTWKELRKLDLI